MWLAVINNLSIVVSQEGQRHFVATNKSEATAYKVCVQPTEVIDYLVQHYGNVLLALLDGFLSAWRLFHCIKDETSLTDRKSVV